MVGENGLITQAKKAKTETELAQQDEKEQMQSIEDYTGLSTSTRIVEGENLFDKNNCKMDCYASQMSEGNNVYST